MRLERKYFLNTLISLIVLLGLACNSKSSLKKATPIIIDSIYRYLDIGDSIFQSRNRLDNFSASMRYFDSAAQIANQYDSDSAKRNVNAYLANAYDAWNQMPEKTIYYYQQVRQNSIDMKDTDAVGYNDVLIAYAYMKAKDSANAIQVCERCSKYEIPPNNKNHKDYYYNELAYVAASVKNYPLAYEYSNKIEHPEKIINSNINFKSHQTITQLSLHLYYLHTDMPVWIDSARALLKHSSNLSDSLYYYQVLVFAFDYLNQKDSIKKYESIISSLNNRFSNVLDKSNAKNSFLEHEVSVAEKQKTLAELEKQGLIKTTLTISLILLSLLTGTLIIWANRRKIKEKNKALAQLNQQLDNKATQNELLVKEMHHRVKNNLTLIYSLLEMQGRKTNNEETQEQLLAARQRIESIAITHEQLYANQDGVINMHEYISTLVQHILNGQSGNIPITTSINIEENIVLSTNTCLPLAMLINEWLTNTMKYAVSDNNEIVATINAYQIDNTITLIYFDTGDVVENNNIKAGLGSKIISLLCKQINAALDTNHNNRALNYKVSFNLKNCK